ncbi:MAG: CoA transferase, partial [Candidatus Binatia bacterium]|nr:CoA transferase [Candidatus Binatia bacterium]
TPRLSLTPGKVRHAGPSLGRHNGEILGDLLGYSEEEIARINRLSEEKSARTMGTVKNERSAQVRSEKKTSTAGLPLKGVRILDLSRYLAGPFGSSLLADFGAEVIQVEMPGQGDTLRTIYPVHEGTSMGWVTIARNKKSITLNLKEAEGQELARRLAAVSDVVLENFRPGTLERWNLGYEELKGVNPGIILVRVSGFGQDGPYKDRASFDTIGSAFGGLTYLTGDADAPPQRTGLGVCDCLAGMFNALGTLLALYYRDARETGEGQVVDVAQYEAIFRISEFSAAAYQKLGLVRERSGNGHPSAAPVNHYRTGDDQWVVLLAHRDNLFARMAKAIGREELLRDARFSSLPQRAAHAAELDVIVGEWMGQHTISEVMEVLVAAQVPVSPIYSIADIFKDPHYQARSNLVQVEESAVGPVKLPAATPRLSLTPGRVRWGGPRLGQHNEEIYRELLGIQSQELEKLRNEGVV